MLLKHPEGKVQARQRGLRVDLEQIQQVCFYTGGLEHGYLLEHRDLGLKQNLFTS